MNSGGKGRRRLAPGPPDPHYGTGRRLGAIIPSLNVTFEPEFNAMAPREISVHVTRLLLERGNREGLVKMAENVKDASKLLQTANVGAVLYACTSGSLVGGNSWEASLTEMIESAAEVPAVTTARAVVDALRSVGARKVAVATPYSEELNHDERRFFESNGFKITEITGLGYTEGEDLHREPPETAIRMAREVDSRDADAVFLSCTDLKTATVVQGLEKELGKPVLSSNVASLWAALKLLGVKTPVRGYGSLLRGIGR